MTHPEIQGLLYNVSSFSTDLVSQYDLVIKLEENTVTCLIGERAHRKVLLVTEVIAAGDEASDPLTLLEGYIAGNPFLKGPFKTVRFLIINQKVTLVPFEMYNDQDKAHYLSFNVDLDSEDSIFTMPVPSIRAECIFAVPGKLHYRLTKIYPTATFHHLAAVALENIQLTTPESKNQVAFHLSFSGNSFFVHVLRDQELVFFNNFIFSNPEEFLYYILNIAEKLNLKPANTRFVLSGSIDRQGALHKELLTVVAGVEFAPAGNIPENAEVKQPVAWHRQADLLKLFFCAS
ncbi:MAG: DUF3822 family protein [Bacteroidales bacterium]